MGLTRGGDLQEPVLDRVAEGSLAFDLRGAVMI